MRAHLVIPADLRAAFAAAGVTEGELGDPTVIACPSGHHAWPSMLDSLTVVFEKSQAAAIAGSSVVYVVSSDALLGRTGPLDAMAANGVVSAARTLAAELRKAGVPVNCLGVGDDTPPAAVVEWAVRLLDAGVDGPTGELVQLGGAQIGKALS
ncbi:MAG: hypothetical protein WEA76_12250 [Acidimicrobiia bacterium]